METKETRDEATKEGHGGLFPVLPWALQLSSVAFLPVEELHELLYVSKASQRLCEASFATLRAFSLGMSRDDRDFTRALFLVARYSTNLSRLEGTFDCKREQQMAVRLNLDNAHVPCVVLAHLLQRNERSLTHAPTNVTDARSLRALVLCSRLRHFRSGWSSDKGSDSQVSREKLLLRLLSRCPDVDSMHLKAEASPAFVKEILSVRPLRSLFLQQSHPADLCMAATLDTLKGLTELTLEQGQRVAAHSFHEVSTLVLRCRRSLQRLSLSWYMSELVRDWSQQCRECVGGWDLPELTDLKASTQLPKPLRLPKLTRLDGSVSFMHTAFTLDPSVEEGTAAAKGEQHLPRSLTAFANDGTIRLGWARQQLLQCRSLRSLNVMIGLPATRNVGGDPGMLLLLLLRELPLLETLTLATAPAVLADPAPESDEIKARVTSPRLHTLTLTSMRLGRSDALTRLSLPALRVAELHDSDRDRQADLLAAAPALSLLHLWAHDSHQGAEDDAVRCLRVTAQAAHERLTRVVVHVCQRVARDKRFAAALLQQTRFDLQETFVRLPRLRSLTLSPLFDRDVELPIGQSTSNPSAGSQ